MSYSHQDIEKYYYEYYLYEMNKFTNTLKQRVAFYNNLIQHNQLQINKINEEIKEVIDNEEVIDFKKDIFNSIIRLNKRRRIDDTIIKNDNKSFKQAKQETLKEKVRSHDRWIELYSQKLHIEREQSDYIKYVETAKYQILETEKLLYYYEYYYNEYMKIYYNNNQ